uniref:Type II toxin-antitoxin system MqsA family antitoxin n=1 Tax=Geobacter metallireducens TaxID=28232 RepID=A0A831UBT3_GEOME
MAHEFKNGDPCPLCGEPLQEKAVTETFTYKERTLEYPNYVVHYCAACDDTFVGNRTMKESGRRLRDFYREVDGLLTAGEIRRIRTKLGYTQDDLSDLLGGGAKAFARYENSDVVQSLPMDNLLRILDSHPQAIAALEHKHLPKGKVISTSMVYHTKIEEGRMVANYGQRKN